MRSLAFRCLLTTIALLSGASTEGFATSLSVAPTRVDLATDARSGSVSLDNTGDLATTVQVQTFAWKEGNSIESLEPTRRLLAVPAVFKLPAGGRQVIRVASREEVPADVETAYRMVITEVPSAGPDTASGIRFALRLSLPVFITPRGASAVPAWQLSPDGRGLDVRNDGNAHLHVRGLVIRDQQSGRILADVDSPSYVLAREAHSWPDLLAVGSGSVLVEAQTNLGALSIVLER